MDLKDVRFDGSVLAVKGEAVTIRRYFNLGLPGRLFRLCLSGNVFGFYFFKEARDSG